MIMIRDYGTCESDLVEGPKLFIPDLYDQGNPELIKEDA